MQTSSISIAKRLIEDFKLKWQAIEDEGKKKELIAYTQVAICSQTFTFVVRWVHRRSCVCYTGVLGLACIITALLFQAQVIKVAKIRDELRGETYTEQTTPALHKVFQPPLRVFSFILTPESKIGH